MIAGSLVPVFGVPFVYAPERHIEDAEDCVRAGVLGHLLSSDALTQWNSSELPRRRGHDAHPGGVGGHLGSRSAIRRSQGSRRSGGRVGVGGGQPEGLQISTKLSESDCSTIWDLHGQGLTINLIAQRVGRAYSSVATVIKASGGFQPGKSSRSPVLSRHLRRSHLADGAHEGFSVFRDNRRPRSTTRLGRLIDKPLSMRAARCSLVTPGKGADTSASAQRVPGLGSSWKSSRQEPYSVQ